MVAKSSRTDAPSLYNSLDKLDRVMDGVGTPQPSTARSRTSTIDSTSLSGTTPRRRSRASSAYAAAYGCWTPSPHPSPHLTPSCNGCKAETDEEFFVESRAVAVENEIKLGGLARDDDERDSDEYTVHLDDGCRVTKLTYESRQHLSMAESVDDSDDISSTKAQPSEHPGSRQQRACDCDSNHLFVSCLDPPVVHRERTTML